MVLAFFDYCKPGDKWVNWYVRDHLQINYHENYVSINIFSVKAGKIYPLLAAERPVSPAFKSYHETIGETLIETKHTLMIPYETT